MNTVLTDAELDDLVRRFDERTLPKPEWTHAAHLAVGLTYASRYGRDEALARLRVGIRRLNESHGTINSTTGGYHETVTRAYVQLLTAFADRHGDKPVAERVAVLLDGALAAKDVLLRFYSRPRLESSEARLSWVEPDLAPLALQPVCDRDAATLAGAEPRGAWRTHKRAPPRTAGSFRRVCRPRRTGVRSALDWRPVTKSVDPTSWNTGARDTPAARAHGHQWDSTGSTFSGSSS